MQESLEQKEQSGHLAAILTDRRTAEAVQKQAVAIYDKEVRSSQLVQQVSVGQCWQG